MATIDTTGIGNSARTSKAILTLLPGWWILPSVLGGLYLWYRVISAFFG